MPLDAAAKSVHICPLQNPVMRYDWGSRDELTRLFGLANPTGEPMAEIWMGAHPKAPSEVTLDGEKTTLDRLVTGSEEMLGAGSLAAFGAGLPFLFKVLSAARPLSIQSHPNLQQAVAGFERENGEGVPIDAPHRNYRDANHKPELVYALTRFRAMNGFRPITEIRALLAMAGDLFDEGATWLERDELKPFYQWLMGLRGERRQRLVESVVVFAAHSEEPAWQEVSKLHSFYPGDLGVLSPLLLNVIELSPGEAMFLQAGTLHAYLEGTALEVMASSDNVLRGGLTGKHVDVEQLMDTVLFQSTPFYQLLTQPSTVSPGQTVYPVPVGDFLFSVIEPQRLEETLKVDAAEILFSIEGEQTVVCSGQSVHLKPGDACFVSASAGVLEMFGNGRIARTTSRPQ